jgi:PAS domain S-box-containing protein
LEQLPDWFNERLERDVVWRVSRELFLMATMDGHFCSANPGWSVLGYSLTNLVGTRFEDLAHPGDRAVVHDAFASVLRGDVVRDLDIRLRAKDGSYRLYSWYLVPEADNVYAAGRDVTERKHLEEQLRQSQKMEAVGQLTGGLAHDFNNLLIGISGSLEMLQKRIAEGRFTEIQRYIDAAQESSRRAASLTHRLLAFSRRQTLDPKAVDVHRLIGGMEELIRRTMGPQVETRVVSGAPSSSLVDSNQLESALLNLCINARDAMPHGGKLVLQTDLLHLGEYAAGDIELPPGEYVCVAVSDTGTGMSPETIKRAFDPFFTTKPLGEGTGLGLSMVYGFARQSGGQLRIQSELGAGTTMRLYLPRYEGTISAEKTPTPAPTVPSPRAGDTVLVVDDEPTVRMLVTEVLQGLGYATLEAADGGTAIRTLQSNARIDLLITDVGLPGGMNGRQVADGGRTLRPDLQVLFITGYAENAVFGKGHLNPGMLVLTKPFTTDDLVSRIGQLTAQH